MQCDITMQVSSNWIDSELSFNQNPGPYAGVFRPSVWAAERVKKKIIFFCNASLSWKAHTQYQRKHFTVHVYNHLWNMQWIIHQKLLKVLNYRYLYCRSECQTEWTTDSSHNHGKYNYLEVWDQPAHKSVHSKLFLSVCPVRIMVSNHYIYCHFFLFP